MISILVQWSLLLRSYNKLEMKIIILRRGRLVGETKMMCWHTALYIMHRAWIRWPRLCIWCHDQWEALQASNERRKHSEDAIHYPRKFGWAGWETDRNQNIIFSLNRGCKICVQTIILLHPSMALSGLWKKTKSPQSLFSFQLLHHSC